MNARGGEPAGLSRDRESERASERTKQSHSSYSPWQQKHSAADDCPSTAIQRAGERGGREGGSGAAFQTVTIAVVTALAPSASASATPSLPSLFVRPPDDRQTERASERATKRANGRTPGLGWASIPRSSVSPVSLSFGPSTARPCPSRAPRAPRCPRNACCDHSRRIE